MTCCQSGMAKPGLSCPAEMTRCRAGSGGEPARQGRELRHGKLFGARGGIDPGGADAVFCIGGERLQALAQHLAALAEGSGGDFFKVAQARRRDGFGERLECGRCWT